MCVKVYSTLNKVYKIYTRKAAEAAFHIRQCTVTRKKDHLYTGKMDNTWIVFN